MTGNNGRWELVIYNTPYMWYSSPTWKVTVSWILLYMAGISIWDPNEI
jgi:hypothetical protein